MTKRYAILQRKLQELDSELSTTLSFPPHIAAPKTFADDFDQRLYFLRRCHAAEVASRPSKPHHLAHIARRLDRLDALFQASRARADQSPTPDPAAGPLDDGDDDDACSCTESCLNDDGEAASEPGSEGPAIVEYGGDKVETASLGDPGAEFSDCLGDEDRLSRGGDRRVVLFGVTFVLVLLVVVFGWFRYGSYDQRFENKFLTPT